jgi:ectoine hydroxylase-related dioxygenase (phytanoyl-CoA dioxygenase family)
MKDKNFTKLQSDGYLVIKKVFTKKQTYKLKNLCNSIINNKAYYKKIKKPNPSKHKLNTLGQDDLIYNLQNKNYEFIKIASNKKILKIVENYLNYGSYRKEQINLHQLTARSPKISGSEQTLHLDSRMPGLKFPIKIVVTVMLESFNKKNGTTRLIPKSHLIHRFPNKKDDNKKNIKYIKGNPGDILIMNGSLWHAGSKNHTKNSRWGILITYVRWYLKQAFDIPAALPRKIKVKCKNYQLKLLGFYSKPPINEYDRINALKKSD